MERANFQAIDDISQKELDIYYMQIALEQARLAFEIDEVPVGAVLVWNNSEIIAVAHNFVEKSKNATMHSELICLNGAMEKLQMKYLTEATMYSTLEPCPMCSGALILTKVKRLVYGASDPKSGAVRSLYSITEDKRLNHQLEITGGVMEHECSQILKDFFSKLRERT